MTARNICYTLNNYTPEEEALYRAIDATYHTAGREIGEEGTPHLQGYAEFANSRPWAWIHKRFPRAHVEKRAGTAAQAIAYCHKDGDFWEIGEPKKQGKRSDLDEIKTALADGVDMLTIADSHFGDFCRYHKSFSLYRQLLAKHRTEPPKAVWLWGRTGVGKTRRATTSHSSFYMKPDSKWWDGYEQQEAIIIDDWRPNHWLCLAGLLTLTDRYPYQGEVKSGFVKINSPYIYITSDRPPTEVWSGEHKERDLSQLLRRIEVAEVTG